MGHKERKRRESLNATLDIFPPERKYVTVKSDADKENCRELAKSGIVEIGVDNYGGMLARLTSRGITMKTEGGFKRPERNWQNIVALPALILSFISTAGFFYTTFTCKRSSAPVERVDDGDNGQRIRGQNGEKLDYNVDSVQQARTSVDVNGQDDIVGTEQQ